MPTTDEPAEVTAAEAEMPRPARDETARARIYLDLWERHLIQSAVDAPIRAGIRLPA
jgi:hypothetical protein